MTLEPVRVPFISEFDSDMHSNFSVKKLFALIIDTEAVNDYD